jgi:catechol 2,3-dioxygenase-like lactoylglutathione lyase family enzyme
VRQLTFACAECICARPSGVSGQIRIDRANTVLYCDRWAATVEFYRTTVGLPVEFENDWFVEFRVAGSSMLSVADASRATIDSVGGSGLTLTWRVEDIAAARSRLEALGVEVTPLQVRWRSTVFYCHDPEGHRIEFWTAPPGATPD